VPPISNVYPDETARGSAAGRLPSQGIASAPETIASAEPAAPTFTGLLADVEREAYRAQQRADRPESKFLEEVKANTVANPAAAEYRQQIMAERANAKEEAERQRYMRMAQFFAKWGSTPGPTLAAGLSALEKTIPDLLTDEKDQKKAKRELDKVMYDIDNATRQEELGHIKEARALKEKAADRALSLNQFLAQAKSSENVATIQGSATRFSAEKQLEAAKVRERGASSDRAEARTAREAREAEVRWQASRGQLETVESNIAREKAAKPYTEAQERIRRAEAYPGARNDQGAVDLSKIPEALRASYSKDKEYLEDRDKEFDGRRRRAQAAVNKYARQVGVDVDGADSKTMSPEDTAALNWANANPRDPRAAQIKQRLGVQ
jgi:hypothetical protein